MSNDNLSMTATLETKAPKILAKSGSYTARIIKFYNLGLQKQEWQGEILPDKYVFSVHLEIQKQKHVFSKEKGEQMQSIKKDMIFSNLKLSKIADSKAHFSKMLLALGGEEKYQKLSNEIQLKAGDDNDLVTKLLNEYITENDTCMISIIHNKSKSSDEIYANIASFFEIPEGMNLDKRENPLSIFDWSKNINTFYEMPKWIQEKVKESKNWKLGNYKIKEEKQETETETLPPISVDDLAPTMPF